MGKTFFAQQVTVDAVLDTAKLRIGEQAKVDIYLSYEANKDIHVEWPSIGDTITEKVEVISTAPIDTTFPDKSNSTKILQHQQIIVSVYDSGYYVIPGFKFIINKDTAHPLFTKPLFLEVHTVPTDTSAAKIKDIKAPFEEPFNWKWYINYLYALDFILGLLLLVCLLTVYYVRKRIKDYVEPEKPKIPAHITALAMLHKVKEENIWQQGKVKEYYSSISDTVRLYIEERFHVNALESTTDEIMSAFKSQVVDRESKGKLQQLLTLSDLVKFAKQTPIEAEHYFTLQNAFDFVNGTKREEEVAVDNAGNLVSGEAASAYQPQNNPAPQQATQPNHSYSDYTQKQTNTSAPDIAVNNPISKPSTLKLTVLILIALAGLAALIYLGVIMFGGSKPTEATTIAATVEQIQPRCPLMIDPNTRLDSVELVESKVIAYYYSLLNIKQGQIDPEMAKNQLRPNILNTVKTSPEFKGVRAEAGTLEYRFSDTNGNPLFSISITPEDYLN